MKSDKTKMINQYGPIGSVLFLAYAGAAFYFVQHAHGFFGFIWALLKAIVWPAIIVHHVFVILNV